MKNITEFFKTLKSKTVPEHLFGESIIDNLFFDLLLVALYIISLFNDNTLFSKIMLCYLSLDILLFKNTGFIAGFMSFSNFTKYFVYLLAIIVFLTNIF